jgi:hypothetical protein
MVGIVWLRYDERELMLDASEWVRSVDRRDRLYRVTIAAYVPTDDMRRH